MRKNNKVVSENLSKHDFGYRYLLIVLWKKKTIKQTNFDKNN
jgi:hypothetical protein